MLKAKTVGIEFYDFSHSLYRLLPLFQVWERLVVVTLSGYYVTTGVMTIGSFVAFISYIAILIFPF